MVHIASVSLLPVVNEDGGDPDVDVVLSTVTIFSTKPGCDFKTFVHVSLSADKNLSIDEMRKIVESSISNAKNDMNERMIYDA